VDLRPAGEARGAEAVMTHLQVNIDGDGAWPDIDPTKFVQVTWERIARLPAGMTSGGSSVGILLRLPDGTPLFAEQSLKNLRAAVALFDAAEKLAAETPTAERPQ